MSMQWIDTQKLGFKLYCLQIQGTNFVLADPVQSRDLNTDALLRTGFKLHQGTGRYYTELTIPTIKALRNLPETRDVVVDKDQIIVTPTTLEEKHDNNQDPAGRSDSDRQVRQDGPPASGGELSPGTGSNVSERNNHSVPEQNPDGHNRPGAGPDTGTDPGLSGEEFESGFSGHDPRAQSRDEDSGGRDSVDGDHDRGTTDDKLNPDHFFIGQQITRKEGFRPMDRCKENIEAIRILKKLEKADKPASAVQKGKLVKFNGWGGLATVFESYPSNEWARAAKEELPNILTADEIEMARASTLNSHYTPPVTIKQIWMFLEKMGFKGGNILDPAIGPGNFYGLAPKEIVHNSNLFGIELDPVPGRLAQKVYPDAKIFVQGYEKTILPDNFFDLAITNVPFGDYSVNDSQYPEYNRTKIHDYYFLKSLNKVKPDGVVAFITSSYTMDKKDGAVRRQLHKNAKFLGAVRLPVNAQQAQAGTLVTTDIIFLQKRSRPLAVGETAEADWLDTEKTKLTGSGGYPTDNIIVNKYFLNHPEQIAGELILDQGEYGRRRPGVSECTPEELNKHLSRIFNRMAKDIELTPPKTTAVKKEDIELVIGEKPGKDTKTLDAELHPNANFGSYIYENGSVVQVVGKKEDGWVAKDCGLGGRTKERMIGLIHIKDALRRVLALEKTTPVNDATSFQETTLENARKELNDRYDEFVKNFGFVNKPVNTRLFNDDPEIGLVMSIENYDQEKNTATKADILSQRVIFDRPNITRTDTVHDGFMACMDQLGRVDIGHIAEIAGVSRMKALRDLEAQESIFFDPERAEWLSAPEYLSGNVRHKLKTAIAANDLDKGRYTRNIEALEKAQPKDLKPSEIFVRFGAPWVPPDVIRDFMADKMQLSAYDKKDITIKYRDLDGTWIMDAPYRCSTGNLALKEYGTKRRPFFDIIDLAMNRKKVTVYDTFQQSDGSTKRVLNYKETLVAEQKLDKIQSEFNRFLWQDQDRASELLRIYNDKFNNYVPPKYDGSHLTLPGMSGFLTPRPCQKNGIWRGLISPTTLLAHEVGVGKTLELVCLAMEMKRLGKANKPTVVIPNHMLEQITREAQQLYPSARILMVTKKDFEKKNRRVFMGKIANNNWDLVVMTRSMFKKISLDPKFERRLLRDERAEFRSALEEVKANKTARRYSVKRIEAAVKRFDERIEALEDQIKTHKDSGLIIDDMGIDTFLVDESHNYKNLELTNPGTEVENGISGSQQARDMFQKIQWLFDKRGSESGVIFASGTPVSNNIFELYNIQRYLQPSILREAGVHHVNAWAAAYLSPKSQWEPNPSGTGWTLRTRYEMINIPELMEKVRMTMDVVRADDIDLERPEVETINITVPMSTAQSVYMQHLADRVTAIKSGLVTDNKQDNLLKIVSEGRQLSLDPKLIENRFNSAGMELEDFELDDADHRDKIDSLVDGVVEDYHDTFEQKGVQLVFCDIGTPSAKSSYNVYDRIKRQLIDAGIPEKEIAYIHDFKTDEAKAQAFKKVRDGEIRVFMGSTSKMGEGSNMQDRIAHIHDLDAPWRPSDIMQRGGRGQRQGNMFKVMKRTIYTTQDSFDLFMWNVLKVKADQFTRIMSGDTSIRRLDMAVDPTYAETAAITTGNPLIREKLEIDQRANELEALEAAHRDSLYDTATQKTILRRNIQVYEAEAEMLKEVPEASEAFALWRMDLKAHGFKMDFEGDRQNLTKTVANVFKKTGLHCLTGITCGGLCLQVDRYLNKMTGKNQTYWTLLNKDGKPTDHEYANVRTAEESLQSRELTKQEIPKRLNRFKEELKNLKNEKPEEFEFAQELENVKALQREIESKIQEMENLEKPDHQAEQEADESVPCVA